MPGKPFHFLEAPIAASNFFQNETMYRKEAIYQINVSKVNLKLLVVL